MSLIEDLNWRHAVKAFKPNQTVCQEHIDKIIEATRLAPTSSGLQPFRVLVVENLELKEQLVVGALNPECMRECSHVIVFAGWNNYSDEKIDEVFDRTSDERNLPRGRFGSYTNMLKSYVGGKTAEQNFNHIARQAYIAMGLALAQAAELKVDSCPAEGFNRHVVDNVLELNKLDLKSIALIYIGVADPDRDWISNMSKVRLPKDEFVIEFK